MEGRYSNYSLRSTAAMHLYDHDMDEQQISEITGHKSVAIRNYKRTSIEKQWQVSDVLYGKAQKKSVPTSTVTLSSQLNFDLGMNSQAVSIDPPKPKQGAVTIMLTVNVNVNKVQLEEPVITINQPQITVSPVINLRAKDLPRNEQGHLQLPEIDITLT